MKKIKKNPKLELNKTTIANLQMDAESMNAIRGGAGEEGATEVGISRCKRCIRRPKAGRLEDYD